MTARPRDHVISHKHIRACHWLVFLMLGAILGGLLTMKITADAKEITVKNYEITDALAKACRWPRTLGGQTTIILREDGYECRVYE